MAIRVPRIEQAGRVGDVGIDTVSQEFQSLQTPLLDGSAKGLLSAGAGLSEASVAVEKHVRDQENLKLLTTQDEGDKASRAIIDEELSNELGNAVGGSARVAQQVAALRKQLGEGEGLTLAGQAAHKAYLRSLENSIRTTVGGHERAQTQLHTIKLQDTSIANAVNDGVVNYRYDSILDRSEALIHMRAWERAKNSTSAPEEQQAIAERLARENSSTMYLQAINRALAPNSEGEPTDLRRAKELLESSKSAGRLDANKGDLLAAEKAVGAVVDGANARRLGNDLYATHKDDAVSAQRAIEALPESADVKARVQAQYDNRRRIVEEQDKRVKQQTYDAAMVSAQRGNGSVSDATLATMPASLARIVKAEMAMHSLGSVTTDVATKREWDGMLDTERAKLTLDEFINRFGSKFATIDKTRQIATEEWRSAQHGRQSIEAADVVRLDAQSRTDNKAESEQARTVFNSLMAERKSRLFPSDSKNDKMQRAAYVEAAITEFNERNTSKTPMSHMDTIALLDTLSQRVIIDGDDFLASAVVTEARDEEGKLLKGSADVDKAMSGIDRRDRLEVLQWYRKSKGIDAAVPVKMDKDFSAFVLSVIQTVAPENMRKSITDVLNKEYNITSPSKSAIDDFYRRWLINKNGR